MHHPQITQAPAIPHAFLAPRQDTSNALSALISQAITFGNSILSELNQSTASTASASTPTSSTSATPYTTPSTSASPTSTPSTIPAAATPTPEAHHNNIGLIAGLAAGFGALLLLCLLGLLWFCVRRRRKSKAKAKSTAKYDEKHHRTDSWVASTEDQRSHLTAPDEGYAYNSNGYPQGLSIPAPIMAERAHRRPDHAEYESMSPVSTNSPNRSHANPFVSEHDIERPVPPFLTHNVSEPSSWESSENNRPIIKERPRSPAEMYADVPESNSTLVNGSHGVPTLGGLHGHDNGSVEKFARPGGPSIWPSKTATENFNFGLKHDGEMAEPGIPLPRKDGEFGIARRPVSGQPTAL